MRNGYNRGIGIASHAILKYGVRYKYNIHRDTINAMPRHRRKNCHRATSDSVRVGLPIGVRVSKARTDKRMISGFYLFWLTLGTLGFSGLFFWFFKRMVLATDEYGNS